MEKDGSYANDELDMAFVEGEGNRTISGGADSDNNWNLLEDPAMLKEEPSSNSFNLKDLNENESVGISNMKMPGITESSIHFQDKAKLSAATHVAKRIEEEDEDDLKELYAEMCSKDGSSKGKSAIQ